MSRFFSLLRLCSLSSGFIFGLSIFFTSFQVQAYSTSKTIIHTSTGQTMTFSFTGLPKASGTITVGVRLYGDYNSSNENAAVTIEGRAQAVHPGGSVQCSTTGYLKNYSMASTYADDGRMTVVVKPSSSVSGTLCSGDKVVVTLTYNTSTTSKPDLQISYLSVSPSTVAPGGTVTLTYRIYNAGSVTASYFYTRFYFSTDSTITTSDTYLGHYRYISLGPRATSSTYTYSVRLPTSIPTGYRYIGGYADYSNRISETSETNNTRAYRITVGASKPDLQVEYLYVTPTTVSAGSSVTVRYRIYNAGTMTASSFSTRFYLSTDTSITSGDTYLGHERVLTLSPGGRSTTYSVTMRIPTNISGTRYLGAYADYNYRISESNESNNTRYVTLNVQNPNGPDLVVEYLSASTTVPSIGGTMTIRYRIYNSGRTTASSFYTRFYLSTDTSITTSDIYLGHERVLTLSAGARSTTYSVTVTIPSTARVGTMYLGAIADYNNRIAERYETNNTRSYRLSIQASLKADLQVEYLYVSPSTPVAGATVSVRYRIYNAGRSTASSFYTRFYLSTDSTITTSDTYLGYQSTLTLRGLSRTTTYTVSMKIPTTAKVGPMYLGVFTDYSNKISEASETNNTRAYRITVQAPPKPDLQVDYLTVSPTTVSQNSNITIRYRVYNAGRATASSFYTRFYISKDSTITTSDTYLGYERLLSVSAGGRSSIYSVTVKVPYTAPGGSVYLGAFTDYNNKISETSETNNTRAVPLKVIVVSTPNLVAASAAVTPTKALVGSSIKLTYKISNKGTADAPGYSVGVYFSTDSTITTADKSLLTFTLSGLAKGKDATGTRTITLSTSLAASKGYIGFFVDYNAKIKESSETDNTTASPFTILVDKDKDGVPNDVDCDDNDKTRYPAYGGKPAAKEICDKKDNDCNGKVDDNCTCLEGSKRDCYTAGPECTKQLDGSYKCKGICKSGQQTCKAGKWGTCTGEIKPSKEVCDNKDNNCNGIIDDQLKLGCYGGSSGCTKQADGSYKCDGVCRAGFKTCKAGKWSSCFGEIKPSQELCDNLDNNCDGKVDENIKQACYTGGYECSPQAGGAYTCRGTCKAGTQICTTGNWGACTGEVKPSKEICDRKDNDCDGKIDNGLSCPEPVPEPIPEPTPEPTPEPVADAGVEPSTEPMTDAGAEPIPDQTIQETTPEGDCYTAGCPKGHICKKGKCEVDPCDGVYCQPGEFCREGQCVMSCACLKCPSGEKCVDGKCKAEPCAGVTCQGNETCDPGSGQCSADPCLAITCSPKLICVKGKCVDDPCNFITCLANQECRNSQCFGKNCGGELTVESVPEPTVEPTTQEPTPEPTVEPTTQEPTPEPTVEPTVDASSVDEPHSNYDKQTGSDGSGAGDASKPSQGGCVCSHSGQPAVPSFILFFGVLFFFLRLRRR